MLAGTEGERSFLGRRGASLYNFLGSEQLHFVGLTGLFPFIFSVLVRGDGKSLFIISFIDKI